MTENRTFVIGENDLQELARLLLDGYNATTSPKSEDKYLTSDEVCTMLRISRATLWRRERQGEIVPSHFGAKKFYPESHVRAIMEGATA